MANVLANMRYVQQQGELGREQGQNRLLQGLAPQIMAGDPAAFEKASVFAPKQAQQLQQAGDNKWKRISGLVKYMKSARDSGNLQAAEAAWQQQARPYITKVTGVEPPATFAEAAPHFAQLEAKIAMVTGGNGGEELKSLRVGGNGNYWAIQGGQFVDTGIKADPRTQLRDQPGVAPSIVDLRTGSLTPLQAGPAQAEQGAPTRSDMDADIGLANDMIAAGIPEAQVDAFLRSRGQRAESAPTGMPAGGGLAAPRPSVSPAEAERLRLAQEANRRAQEAAERASRGTAPAGYRFNAAGDLERIPGAPEPAPTRATVPTEGERKAAGFLQRMEASGQELDALRAAGYRPEDSLRDYYTAGEGAALNWMASPQGQQNRQQQEDWVRAKLRLESGAVIADEEMDREIKTYFPQPGDTDEVIESKARSRERAREQMRIQAGRALESGQPSSPSIPAAAPPSRQPTRATNPQTGEVVELRNGQWVPVQ